MAIDVHWFLPAVSGATFSQRWPYGPGTPFRPDLGIEIDGNFRKQPAVAVVSGTLYVLPLTLKTCSVLLIPHAEVNKALASDGIGEVAFYLRTLDLDDLVTRFKASVTEKLPRGVTKTQQIDNLKAGKVPVPVDSGDDIALMAPEVAGQDKGLVQFEVIYAPRRGSLVGIALAIAYALRLTNAANRYRRLDPMSFYYRVKRGGTAAQTRIAPAHATHPFWTSTTLTLRGLIELRDEYDRPFATPIDVTVSPAPTKTVTLQDANWAHHEVAAPGTAGLVDIEITKTSWRLTRLPTSGRSRASQTNQEEVPFHFPVQSIYMAQSPSPDSWFVKNDFPLSFFTEKNRVTPLVDGIETFKTIVSYLQRVRRTEQIAWLAGWWATHDFELIDKDSSSTLLEMAKAIDAVKAEFRVILWSQTLLKNNKRAVEAVNLLPNKHGFGILDNQTRVFGSHHQKFLVVFLSQDEAVTFCGGIDINPNRIDNPDHSLFFAYHDTHAQLEGPVTADFMRLYVERWNDHNDAIADPAKRIRPPNVFIKDTDGDCFVQVTRTMPRGTHSSVINGIQGSFKAVQRAVQRAQHFIYIEEQYLVPYYGHVPFDPDIDFPGKPGFVQDLLDALKRIKFLLIVIPHHVTAPQVMARRREFLEALSRAAGTDKTKINVYYLKRKAPSKKDPKIPDETALEEDAMLSQGDISNTKEAQKEYEIMGGGFNSGHRPYRDEIYVHTKVWLVDDVYVKCGSMNVNRRGFTYDSESDFHAVDGAVTRGKRRTALAFRQALFSEHTRLTLDEVPDDPDDVLTWWLGRAKASGRVGVYDWNKFKIPPLMKTEWDIEWKNVIDPDGR